MKGEVSWTHGDGYVGTTPSGKRFSIYNESAPSPMEMVLHGHAACSMIDVVGGLKAVSYTHLTLPKIYSL